MAKQKSFLKFEGKIEDLSFYKGADGTYYVRSKGGVSKERIKNDPTFLRTRENGAEFGSVAQAGKMFRRAIQNLISNVKDRTKTARMMQVLSEVKNQDTTSDRGLRNVHTGIQNPDGKKAFRLFDFNKNAPLDQVLKVSLTLDTTTGKVEIPEFVPNLNLSVPQGATDVGFQAARLRFDFETGASELEVSNREMFVIDDTAASVSLSWANTATGPGLDYYFLKVSFYQETNSKLYPLHNGAHNALQLIEIK